MNRQEKVRVKRLCVPAELGNLTRIRGFAVKQGKRCGLNSRQLNGFKLSLDEVCTNIIRHAYRDQKKTGDILIEMSRTNGSLVTRVIDWGPEFDYDNVISPDLNRYVKEGRKGGFGIYMVRQLNDEVHYVRLGDRNVLTLVNKVKQRPTLVQLLRKNFKPYTMTIKVRFAVISLLIITCISAGTFYLATRSQKRTLSEQFTASYLSILNNFATTSAAFILAEQELLVVEQIFEITREHNSITRITVIDRNGFIVADRAVSNIGTRYSLPERVTPLVEQDHLVQEYDDPELGPSLHFSVPIRIGKKSLGKACMVVDRDALGGEITRRLNLLRIALYTMLFWGIGVGGVSLMANMFVTPIKKIAEEISRVGREGMTGSFHYTGFGEFAEISTAFNKMMHDLRQSEIQLTDQARLKREMQLAQGIQQTLLPRNVPQTEGFDIAARYNAAMEVGGDYYDFFHVDNQAVGIVVGDVSGKGIGGAFMMSIVRTALRLEARGNKNACEVLAKLNMTLYGEFRKGMYITLFYVVLDSRKRVINYASAGHTPMVLYRAESDQLYRLNPRGFPVGLNLGDNRAFKKSIASERISLSKGDLLFIYTDGISEAMNPGREEFGEARLLEAVKKYKDLDVEEFSDKVSNEIKTFIRGYPQNDDITFIVVKEKMRFSEMQFQKRTQLFSLIDQGCTVKQACDRVGVSTSTYYRLKKVREEKGMEALKLRTRNDELAVVDHAVSQKILAVVRDHPEYTAPRISQALKEQKYGAEEVDVTMIRRELRRLKLSSREKRQAYVKRLEKTTH